MSILVSVASRMGAAWNTANGTQRALVVGGVLAGILSLVLVFSWSSQPDMMVLFSGLEAEEASGILSELDELTVPYTIAANGTTIRVPADRVGDLRIRLAGKGLTGSSTIGYEIFDRSNLGMTEFLQQVNYRRALEGELTRTIVSLAEVRNARVHLAIPKQDVFARDQQQPKASVILDLMPGGQLRADQVRGIYALISASVEGLDPASVTLIDSSGRELGGGHSNEFAATTEQLRIQQDVETYLRQKATTILEQVVGGGNAMVQVNASLDFQRVERSTESYNPASSTIRSEQRITGNGTGGDSQETTLTNYEIDKTIESLLDAVGTVEKVTVAVLVNGTLTPDADGALVYADRPATELATLGSIVKETIGYDEVRGDTFEIANLRFTAPEGADLASSPLPWWLLFPSMGSLIRNLVILFAVGLVAWGLRQSSSILVEAVEADRRRRERVLKVEQTQQDDVELRKDVIRDQMNDLAHERPNEVAQVLRSWLVEEKTS